MGLISRVSSRTYRKKNMLRTTSKFLAKRNLELQAGTITSITKSFSKTEIIKFADLSGDTNSIHLSDNIVHGTLLIGQFSKIAGTIMPGDKSLLFKIDNLNFQKPVFAGEELLISLTIERVIKNFLVCEARVVRDLEVCVDGRVTIR